MHAATRSAGAEAVDAPLWPHVVAGEHLRQIGAAFARVDVRPASRLVQSAARLTVAIAIAHYSDACSWPVGCSAPPSPVSSLSSGMSASLRGSAGSPPPTSLGPSSAAAGAVISGAPGAGPG